jgi:endonuclease YncB( thermonuclease family)
MREFYQILMPLLSLFLVRVDLTDLFPVNLDVELLNISDGDTVKLSHGSYKMTLRLARIDSPELHQTYFGSSRSAGIDSRKCLERILRNQKNLTLKIQGYDMYGRVLGDLNSVSMALVEEGCTTIYPHANFSSQSEKFLYLVALKKAKASRRGLWQYGGFLRPKLYRSISKRSGYRPYQRQARSRRPYHPGRKYSRKEG